MALPRPSANRSSDLGRQREYRRASAQEQAPPQVDRQGEAQEQVQVQQVQDRRVATGRAAPAEEAHAALSASLHGVFGNAMLQGALAGRETGPGQVIEGAMTLGAAGVAVADDTAGLFSNSAVLGFLAGAGAPGAAAPAGDGAAPAPAVAVARRAQGEVFDPQAQDQVGAALARGGSPLPGALSARLGAAFGGADFSDVRVHTDVAAAQASQAIHAHAFTVGTDIYFNRGAFDPGSPQGQHLLAHELTHVVQHQEGRLPSGRGGELDVSSPTDPHELEAEARAAEVTTALRSGAADTALRSGAADTALEGADAAGLAPDVAPAAEAGLGAVSAAGVAAV
ncbi:DUF4157 domain-containing protein, partial [Myxococcota bacterium]|nr:DUF4157 domain-containing protein [Myxococcota bacterium]